MSEKCSNFLPDSKGDCWYRLFDDRGCLDNVICQDPKSKMNLFKPSEVIVTWKDLLTFEDEMTEDELSEYSHKYFNYLRGYYRCPECKDIFLIARKICEKCGFELIP